MRSAFPGHRSVRLRFGALALLAFALAGCTTLKDWFHDLDGEQPAPARDAAPMPASYVKEMYRLTTGDPATQADIYADASAAASLTPDTAARLRFALVLATPGHAGSDPERAQSLLRELLAQPALLTSAEKSLATIHLREVEERLVLTAEARRLQSRYTREEEADEAAAERRLDAVEAENRQLKQSLAEAEQKLEAITTIERSIREQTDETTEDQ